MGAEHTSIGIATPSPIRAPPTEPLDKVTGSMIQRDRLGPPGTEARALLTPGRYDRMVPFNVSIAILNHIAEQHLVLLKICGHWPPFDKPVEWAAQVLAFLEGY